MGVVKIIYASLTGNNEEIAEIVEAEFIKRNYSTQVIEISDVEIEDLLDVDIIVVCLYTYDLGALPYEAEDLYTDLENEKLPGRFIGICGSGDTFYEEHFCAAVDLFETRLKACGCLAGAESVKINLTVDDDDNKRLKSFVNDLCNFFERREPKIDF